MLTIALEGNSKDKMATIFFQNNVGQKKIMLRYAKLRIVKKDLMAEVATTTRAR